MTTILLFLEMYCEYIAGAALSGSPDVRKRGEGAA